VPAGVSHPIVGLAAGHAFAREKMPLRFWVLSGVLPVLPDADTIGFYLGVPYESFWGHRGFFHSIFFALLLGVFVAGVYFREKRIGSKKWCLLAAYFFFITATHGILDAFTNGGLGIALLAPFDNTRYFFPWQPIQVAPLYPRAMFSAWGLRVVASELLWVWLPSILVIVLASIIRKRNPFDVCAFRVHGASPRNERIPPIQETTHAKPSPSDD